MARFFASLFVEKAQTLLPGGAVIPETGPFRVFFRKTSAGTVGKPVFKQVGSPTLALNAFFSHSGFPLDPLTANFGPFLISDPAKNRCCDGVGGKFSKKGAFLPCRGVPT